MDIGIENLVFYIGLFVVVRYVGMLLHKVYATALRPGKTLTKLGKWAIVTGATDGIGKAMAMEMAKKRMNLFLISRTKSKLEDMKQEISKLHPKLEIKLLALDCSQMVAEARTAIKTVIDEIQDIGVLVNNVGMSYEAPMFLTEISDKRIEQLIEINIAATVWMTRLVVGGMAERKRGAIVNISSGSANISAPLLSVYGGTKSFVEHFSRCVAAEYANTGVTVQCHIPMFVTTKLSKIRRPDLFTPTPEVYAKSAVASIGYETVSSPYWAHALQLFSYRSIPEAIFSKLSFNVHSSLRARYLKKQASKKAD